MFRAVYAVRLKCQITSVDAMEETEFWTLDGSVMRERGCQQLCDPHSRPFRGYSFYLAISYVYLAMFSIDLESQPARITDIAIGNMYAGTYHYVSFILLNWDLLFSEPSLSLAVPHL